MFISEFSAAIAAYFESAKIIFKYRLWKFLLIPGGISLIFLTIMFASGFIYFNDWSNYINHNWIPGFLSGGFSLVLMNILLWLLLMLMILISYKQIVLALLAPLLGSLSEKVEECCFNHPLQTNSLRDILSDLARGIFINLRNVLWTVFFSLLAFSTLLVPLAGALISAVLLGYIQAYYTGYGLIDYTLERKKYSIKQTTAYMAQHRGSAAGIGLGFILILLIPVIGWVFAPAFGTTAATLVTVRETGA